jgi:nicotinamidase-related amidase
VRIHGSRHEVRGARFRRPPPPPERGPENRRALCLYAPRGNRSCRFDPKRTAVVLIEYQNDFASEGGALHDAIENVIGCTGMLENTRRLVETARAAGATIVHPQISYVPGYRGLALHPYGILKAVVDANASVKGEWGAEIVDELAPQEGDVILEGKRGPDSFATTNLDFILRGRGRDDRTERLLDELLR